MSLQPTAASTSSANASDARHPPLRVALYARVSSDAQARERTIESQVQELRQRIDQDGQRLPEPMLFLDDGVSGATLQRPALERLRDEMAQGRIDRGYVLDADRLSRRMSHLLLLLEEIERLGVQLVLLHGSGGHSPEEELMLRMRGAVAEYEREKITERCRRGRLHAARAGRYNVIGKGVYGYRYVSKHDGGGQAQLNVHLEEAAVVRQIFHWVGIDRLSLREVVRRLARRGIASPRGHARWQVRTLTGMLRNPVYKGQAAFGKTRSLERTGQRRSARGRPAMPRRPKVSRRVGPEQWITIPVTPLVDEGLFAAAAEQLEENRRRHRQSRARTSYLLSGLLVCAGCGYAYIGRRSRGRRYYRCSGPCDDRTVACGNRPARADELEAAVWADVCALLGDPGRIEREYEARLAGEPREEASERSLLRAGLSRLKRQLERLIDALAEGLVTREEFEPRAAGLRQRLARAEGELAEAQRRESEQGQLRLVIGQLEAFAERVRSGLADADPVTRRQIIHTLVKRIDMDTEQVTIVYRVSLSPFDLTPPGGECQDCGVREYPAHSPLRKQRLPAGDWQRAL